MSDIQGYKEVSDFNATVAVVDTDILYSLNTSSGIEQKTTVGQLRGYIETNIATSLTDAGALTGSEMIPVGRTSLFQTTLTKIALFVLGQRDLADYTTLRAYTGNATRIYITGSSSAFTPAGIAGIFLYDPTDTISADDSGTIIVDNLGRRWKRKFTSAVYAGWFNLPTSTSIAADAALQAAINVAQANQLPLIMPFDGKYLISAGLTFAHGQSATDTISYTPKVFWNNTTLYPGAGISAIAIVPRCLLADKATSRGNAHIVFRGGLIIDGSLGSASSSALMLGQAGLYMDDFEFGILEDILVTNFQVSATVVTFTELRHMKISRLVVRTGGVHFVASTAGSFCGDLALDAFEGSGSKAYPPIAFITSGGAVGNPCQLRGIRFDDATIYGSGTVLTASGYSQIGDIWFNSAQWDGPAAAAGESAVEVACSVANASIFDVHFSQCYIVGYHGCGIYAHASGGGVVTSLVIDGLYSNAMTLTSVAPSNTDANSVVCLQGVYGCSVADSVFNGIIGDNTASSLINCDTVTGISVHNTLSTGNTTVPYGVSIGGTGTTDYKITDNMLNAATVVNDYTTGTPVKLVTNNLAI